MPQVEAEQSGPLRCLTIDVEEYYHIEAGHAVIGREQWWDWPSRVEASIDRLLSLFDRLNRKATFFVLGDVLRRTPGVAARIVEQGHEVASHGTNHDRLHRLDPATFRDDLLTSRKLIEDDAGVEPVGYRAPTFSLVPQTAWAIDVLIEAGFQYDSSIFPVRHPWYGVPDAPDRPFFVRSSESGSDLLEIPPLTWRPGGLFGNRKLAVAGGGYFRLLPLGLMKRGLRQAGRDDRPAVLYFHPWEFDPGMPRMPLSRTGMLRTYTGLKSAERKLATVAEQTGRWTTMRDALGEFRAEAERGEPYVLASPEAA